MNPSVSASSRPRPQTPSPNEREAHLRLVSEVKRHKRAIDSHRKELQLAAAALATFEEGLRRRGIKLVLVPTQSSGVGDIHGRPADRNP